MSEALAPATALVCRGCGWTAPVDDPMPFRCPRRDGDDVDHLLVRRLRTEAIEDPGSIFDDPEPHPFVRYRKLLHSWQMGRSRGRSDDDLVAVVRSLDQAIAGVPGEDVGFRETPLVAADDLASSLGLGPGRLLVKDETGNVSGSHKARHLFGVLLWMEVMGGAREAPRFAIASCGNAALAASVLASAADHPLSVYVPVHAVGSVVERMQRLGMEIVACPREAGRVGDPCFHRLLDAIDGGAVPFTCQGTTNGLTIEGGQTLAWEIVSALRRRGDALDRLFVQVGGGALGSACVRGLREAVDLGVLARMPRIHAVQTENVHPLFMAWDRLATRLGAGPELPTAQRASRIEACAEEDVDRELRYAATHRSEFMRPWPEEPRSFASGILDDETYDWFAMVEGMLRTGGFPVLVGEDLLHEAWDLGRRATGIAAEPTGTAGLAGLVRLSRAGEIGSDESVAVLFTGVER